MLLINDNIGFYEGVMKRIVKMFVLFIFAASCPLLQSAPEGQEPRSMFSVIQRPGSFAILMQLLTETYSDMFVSKLLDPRTLIAPTDDAFRQFSRLGNFDPIKHVKEKQNFARYMVLYDKVSPAEITRSGSSFKTMADGNPQLSLTSLGIKVSHSIETSNGWIHVVNKVPVNPSVSNIVYPNGKPNN